MAEGASARSGLHCQGSVNLFIMPSPDSDHQRITTHPLHCVVRIFGAVWRVVHRDLPIRLADAADEGGAGRIGWVSLAALVVVVSEEHVVCIYGAVGHEAFIKEGSQDLAHLCVEHTVTSPTYSAGEGAQQKMCTPRRTHLAGPARCWAASPPKSSLHRWSCSARPRPTEIATWVRTARTGRGTGREFSVGRALA